MLTHFLLHFLFTKILQKRFCNIYQIFLNPLNLKVYIIYSFITERIQKDKEQKLVAVFKSYISHTQTSALHLTTYDSGNKDVYDMTIGIRNTH